MRFSTFLRLAVAVCAGALFALPAVADTVRFAWLELAKDARYDERRSFFRTLSRPFGRPVAGAEVAMREARFVGQALNVEFKLDRFDGADAKELLAHLDRLHGEGVRFFIVDAPAPVDGSYLARAGTIVVLEARR